MVDDQPLVVWVDAQLPPALARWLQELGGSRAAHVTDLGLLMAEDAEIFGKAREAGAVVITKDHDFVQLQERRGAPPRLVWVTCGNVTNRVLRDLMIRAWPRILELLATGEILVEINEVRGSAG